MDTSLLVNSIVTGVIVGFSVAAPVGPIGVLIIRRTLAEGRTVGLISGLGAASADGTYGIIGAFGLTVITSFLTNQQNWLKLIGGLFLCYLGIQTLRARPAEQAATTKPSGRGLVGAFTSTFFLTITNPATILLYLSIFTSLGIGSDPASRNLAAAVLLVAGFFVGSAAWWLVLSTVVNLLRNRFNLTAMLWVNRLSGLIILGFGVVALISLIAAGKS